MISKKYIIVVGHEFIFIINRNSNFQHISWPKSQQTRRPSKTRYVIVPTLMMYFLQYVGFGLFYFSEVAGKILVSLLECSLPCCSVSRSLFVVSQMSC